MIRANELRVGNLVLDFAGKPVKVVRTNLDKIPLETPIPLTPEILEQCGFRRKDWDNQWYPGKFELTLEADSDAFFKYYSDEDNLMILSSDGGDVSIVKENIKYLHQLQNLFFALTDQELKINFNHKAPSQLH